MEEEQITTTYECIYINFKADHKNNNNDSLSFKRMMIEDGSTNLDDSNYDTLIHSMLPQIKNLSIQTNRESLNALLSFCDNNKLLSLFNICQSVQKLQLHFMNPVCTQFLSFLKSVININFQQLSEIEIRFWEPPYSFKNILSFYEKYWNNFLRLVIQHHPNVKLLTIVWCLNHRYIYVVNWYSVFEYNLNKIADSAYMDELMDNILSQIICKHAENTHLGVAFSTQMKICNPFDC